MTTIYIDILVCLNVIVNYFLLLASGKFLSRPYKRWRILLGAFLGGLYSLYILLPQLAQWFTILVELAMAATITLTAFGRKGILKTCSCFFAMSFLPADLRRVPCEFRKRPPRRDQSPRGATQARYTRTQAGSVRRTRGRKSDTGRY